MRAATGGKCPRYAVWENVTGCFSSNDGEDFRAVLQALVEVKHEGFSIPRPKKWERAGAVVGDGFSLAWRTLGAEHWGVPQRRNRIYLVTDFDGGRAGEIFFEPDSLQRNPGEGGKTREAAAGGAGKAADSPGGLIVLNDQGGSAMSVSHDVTGTLRAQEHQHQPLVLAPKQGQGAKSGNGIAAFAQNQRGEVRDLGEKSAALQAQPGMKQQTFVLQDSMIGRKEKNGPQGDGIGEDVSFTLNDAEPDYTVRRLTPKEYARLQGFPSLFDLDKTSTRDEVAAVAIASGFISVDFLTGAVYGHRGPGGTIRSAPKELKGSVANGYKVYNIHVGGIKKQIRAHRLIWIAAHGMIPAGMVVDHINNNKLDNRLENLQLLSREDNSHKAYDDGLYLVGDKSPSAKTTEEQRRFISCLYWNTEKTMKEIAIRFGISQSRVQQIVHEYEWCSNLAIPDPSDEELAFWMGVWQEWDGVRGKKPKTERQVRKWLAAPYTDAAEYKMWGNGIALPCASFVLGAIAREHEYDKPLNSQDALAD